MTYYSLLDGIKEKITTDEQMWKCIEDGGKMYSVDDQGRETLIAENHEFLRGRPAFPVKIL
ncbi:hypothetical protein [Bilifractor porci]|uniref:Uncharacterized protein n=1 Tax=Bilifractor porci TaxID=2606636 RepID=A0A7X2P7C6_9FIRM|nr:hypothetical protein [Bilifractor porci]MST81589.1 hypothetical protein [Bilifractor porci]